MSIGDRAKGDKPEWDPRKCPYFGHPAYRYRCHYCEAKQEGKSVD